MNRNFASEKVFLLHNLLLICKVLQIILGRLDSVIKVKRSRKKGRNSVLKWVRGWWSSQNGLFQSHPCNCEDYCICSRGLMDTRTGKRALCNLTPFFLSFFEVVSPYSPLIAWLGFHKRALKSQFQSFQ